MNSHEICGDCGDILKELHLNIQKKLNICGIALFGDLKNDI